MNIVYLNGKFIPQEDAKISITDRGFLFGDGVYESIPVYEGRIFSLKQHLKRLQCSLEAIKMSPPLSDDKWSEILYKLLSLNDKKNTDQSLYIQITRGPQPERNHAIPVIIQPTIMALCLPPKRTPQEKLLAGLSAITVEDRRRQDCYVKSINLLPNVLAYDQAQLSGSVEAILIRNGEALEGTSSNLFIVKNGILQTPPLSPQILAGITRELILQWAKQLGVPYEEISISEKMLYGADEIWLTGSLKEIYPIVRLNDKLIGGGKVGPLWHKMKGLYEKIKVAEKQQKK